MGEWIFRQGGGLKIRKVTVFQKRSCLEENDRRGCAAAVKKPARKQ